MSSTYSPDLRIELIGTGDQAGVWGATTNNNMAYVLEQAIAGYVSVAVASANQALTYLNGATSVAADNQSVHANIALTTSTGANFAIYAPPSSKQYTIYNASSYTATIYNSTVIGNTTAAGTGVAIPAGKVMTVWSDGTNFVQQNTHLNSPSFTTPALGTPASGTLTNATGLPISTGVSGLGSGVATFLGTPSSANLASAVSDETGSGALVFANSPTLVTPALGTPSSATLTNATGLPIDGGTTGTLPVSRGGTGATSITSGALIKGGGTGAFSAASAADIVGQIGATAVQNATAAANGGVTSFNTRTGAITLSTADVGTASAGLAFNAVGSLVFGSILGTSATSGGTYAAGNGSGQVSSGVTSVASGLYTKVNNLSGTWRYLGATFAGCTGDYGAIFIRIS